MVSQSEAHTPPSLGNTARHRPVQTSFKQHLDTQSLEINQKRGKKRPFSDCKKVSGQTNITSDFLKNLSRLRDGRCCPSLGQQGRDKAAPPQPDPEGRLKSSRASEGCSDTWSPQHRKKQEREVKSGKGETKTITTAHSSIAFKPISQPACKP